MPANPYANNWEARFASYDAKTFHSIETAKAWFQDYKQYLIPEIDKFYDIDTLGFYKKITIIKYEKHQDVIWEE